MHPSCAFVIFSFNHSFSYVLSNDLFAFLLLFFCFNTYFNIILYLQKSWKNSTKNSHIPFTQFPHMLSFCHICIIYVFFSGPLRSKLQTWHVVTYKYLNVYFLKNKEIDSDSLPVVQIVSFIAKKKKEKKKRVFFPGPRIIQDPTLHLVDRSFRSHMVSVCPIIGDSILMVLLR